jgi:hypothetical protein
MRKGVVAMPDAFWSPMPLVVVDDDERNCGSDWLIAVET